MSEVNLTVAAAGALLAAYAGLTVGYWLRRPSQDGLTYADVEDAFAEVLLEAPLESDDIRNYYFVDGADAVLAELRRRGHGPPEEQLADQPRDEEADSA